MKILVFGYTSMVGHVVYLYLQEKGHTLQGYKGDLHDEECIASIIEQGNFDSIINCTAIINQMAEYDKAEAAYINAFFPHLLEKLTKGTHTVVVHRSTDCIFSGAKGDYTILDIPDGNSFYARTKAIGEIINDKDITIRTSLIGPDQNEDGGSLLNWFLHQGGEVNGFANSIWTGLTTDEFARVIEYLLLHKAHGLLHTVPNEAISKYTLLTLFDKYFDGDRKIKRIDNQRIDKSLEQYLGNYDLQIPPYEGQICRMTNWIENHKSIYPQYYQIRK